MIRLIGCLPVVALVVWAATHLPPWPFWLVLLAR
jgi:hypothetical protein